MYKPTMQFRNLPQNENLLRGKTTAAAKSKFVAPATAAASTTVSSAHKALFRTKTNGDSNNKIRLYSTMNDVFYAPRRSGGCSSCGGRK